MRRSEHIVDRYGLVGCPNDGDVLAHDCFGCGAFDTVREDDGLTLVMCRPRAAHMPQRNRHRSVSTWIRLLTPAG